LRDRKFILLLMLASILLVMLNLPTPVSRKVESSVREGISPLQQVFSGIGFRISEALIALRGLGGIVRENQELSAEMVRLQNETRLLRSLAAENADLRRQLGFAQRNISDYIPCEVIGRDVSGWWQTIRLGKGVSENVGENRAVISAEGLVGKTIDVSLHTADVLLISDPACKVSARISRTGAFGIVTGRGVSPRGRAVCRMEFINKNINVLPGDEVLTSGLGGVYPQGILIGYVEKVYQDSHGLYQYAEIEPKADLGMITYVFVESRGDPVDEFMRERLQDRGGDR